MTGAGGGVHPGAALTPTASSTAEDDVRWTKATVPGRVAGMDKMRTVAEARGEVEAVARVRRQHGLVVTEDLIDQAASLLVGMRSAAVAIGPDFGGDTPLTASFAGIALDAVATRQ